MPRQVQFFHCSLPICSPKILAGLRAQTHLCSCCEEVELRLRFRPSLSPYQAPFSGCGKWSLDSLAISSGTSCAWVISISVNRNGRIQSGIRPTFCFRLRSYWNGHPSNHINASLLRSGMTGYSEWGRGVLVLLFSELFSYLDFFPGFHGSFFGFLVFGGLCFAFWYLSPAANDPLYSALFLSCDCSM